MKNNISHFSVLIAFLLFSTGIFAGDGINFMESGLAKAYQQAAKEGKYVFVDANATWCGPCKMLKNKTFKNAAVIEFFNKHFVCVSLDIDQTEGGAFAEKYHITVIPTLIFFTPEGKLLGQHVGFIEAPDLLKLAQQYSPK